jgi:hypothetical protein
MLVFVTRPISGTLLAISLIMSIAVGFKAVKRARQLVKDDDAN